MKQDAGKLKVVELATIGVVRSPRREATDDHWGGVVSRIELDDKEVTAESILGLEAFSHLEIVFVMHLVPREEVELGARHPRNNEAWPLVGILAQRAKRRPNRLGVTRCRLLKVEGLSLVVEGLDAVDGSPVVDVKPYFREFGPRGEVKQPGWVSELMKQYWEG